MSENTPRRKRCGARAAQCECENVNCQGIHVCDCGGSWSGEGGTDSFEVHRFPGGATDPLAAVVLLVESWL